MSVNLSKASKVDEGFEEIVPYQYARPVPLSYPEKKAILKLDCNEATYPPSPLVKERLAEFIQNEPLHWYPDTTGYDLRIALSRYVGYPPEWISVFNGCDHALETLCRRHLRKGEEAVVFAPTYDNFRLFAETSGGKVVPILARTPFETNVPGLDRALTPRTRLVYIANPTNPTGVTYTPKEIAFVLKKASSLLVIVDEAYFEFWGKTSLPLVRNCPNLVIARSFSKAFALAGLRCGYLVSQPENLAAIEKVRNGKQVNTLAQVAAKAALEDLPYYDARIDKLQETKRWFRQELLRMEIETVDTPANFLLIRVADPDEIQRILEGRRIFVRNRSYLPQLQGYLRITIGHQEEMKKVVAALAELPNELFQGESVPQASAASASARW